MRGIDTATWQALGLVLTLLGLVVAALVWRRRGPVPGLRALAWSLLPLAAGLTGVLKLAWDVADLVLNWAARLVFSPVVWLGVLVAGLSVTLFVVSGFLARRRSGPTRSAQVTRGARAQREALPAKGAGPAPAPRATAPAPGAKADDDLADIEALLRKHGIS